MNEIKYMPSDVILVKQVEKCFDYPYGVMQVDAIAPERPAIIVLGGDLTTLPRHANYYTKEIRSVLNHAKLNDVDVYAVYYNFGSRNSYVERINMFQKAGHKVKSMNLDADVFTKRNAHMKQTEPKALYLNKIFGAVIQPIICTDADKTRQNASMLRFYTHSHGGYVVRKLAGKMKRCLEKQNFTPNQIKSIQKHIITVQHGPIAPLENPYFTTLTFGSASDTAMNMHNQFTEYIQDNAGDIYPSYIKTNKSHLFIVGQSKENFAGEHDPKGLSPDDEDVLTPDGKILFTAERNAIVNSLRIAKDAKQIPLPAELVAGHGVDFDAMNQNGKCLYRRMLGDIRYQMQQIPRRGYQK